VASLDGEKLYSILTNLKKDQVLTKIPKFKTDYSVEMSEILESLGMKDAFVFNKADFTGLGSSDMGNLYIGRVLHKTHIEVGEIGTKASAVTLVDVACGASPPPTSPKEVYLDRPFVYMLIDCKNNVPFFIGTVMSVE